MSKLTIFGDAQPGAVEQIENVMRDERAVKGALMADNHKGYSLPIGGVVAYDAAISPTGVGFDIACGNMAVKTNLRVFDLASDWDWLEPVPDSDAWRVEAPDRLMAIKPLMREIQKMIAFGIGRSNPEPVDHALFDSPVWLWLDKVSPGLKAKAAAQLGTVGSGNHYVDLLVDTSGHIWVANHFGSRGLGHTIASGFFALDAGLGFTDRVKESEDAIVFDVDSELGAHYLACMTLAGEYAYAGRQFVIEQVLRILGAEAVETVHNHHNYAWQEDGLWVVRKGATPLTSEPAFIGGSMGDVSVIVRGTPEVYGPDMNECWPDPEPEAPVRDIGNIGSAPHGAGRVMSRTQAAGKLRKMLNCRLCGYAERATVDIFAGETCPECSKGTLKKVQMRDPETAAIDWDGVRADLTERGIVVLGAGADEAPGVYKNLGDVLAAHSNIEILETLSPIGVVMAGPDTFDPFKD